MPTSFAIFLTSRMSGLSLSFSTCLPSRILLANEISTKNYCLLVPSFISFAVWLPLWATISLDL